MQDSKLNTLMAIILQTYQMALQDIGMETLTDYENQMSQMTEAQAEEFLDTKLKNPYTDLKAALLKMEADYEKHKSEPFDTEKAMRMFEALAEMMNAETTNDTEGSDDTEDDNTKH